MQVYIGVELEVVPPKVAEVVTQKVDIMTLSMGSGSGCDGQYLLQMMFLDILRATFLVTREYIKTSRKSMKSYKEKEWMHLNHFTKTQ